MRRSKSRNGECFPRCLDLSTRPRGAQANGRARSRTIFVGLVSTDTRYKGGHNMKGLARSVGHKGYFLPISPPLVSAYSPFLAMPFYLPHLCRGIKQGVSRVSTGKPLLFIPSPFRNSKRPPPACCTQQPALIIHSDYVVFANTFPPD